MTLRSIFLRLALVAVAATSLVVDRPAVAQGVDVQQLPPATTQRSDQWGVFGARTLQHLQWELGLFLNYARNPLVVRDADDEVTNAIVSGQFVGNLMGAIGFGERFDIAIDLPLILAQSGDAIDELQGADAPDASFAIGDIRLIPRLRIIGPRTEDDTGFGLAILLDTRLPTGNPDAYQGESFRIEPKAVAEVTMASMTRLTFNLGTMIREESGLENLDVNEAFTWGAAAAIPVNRADTFFIVPELNGEVPIGVSDVAAEEVPVEALLGGKYLATDSIAVGAGLGTGLNPGYGIPDYRVFAMISYRRAFDPDRDGDGILNDDDACPDNPEDFDGFEDVEGCPDRDNDGDGVPDTRDGEPDASGFGACRDIAEDLDGFEDNDGCIDPDNDVDGVPDEMDGAPDETGFGACRDQAEDADGFEDGDGCVDPDNDLDGVPDEMDGPADDTGYGACRDAAEDADGFEDGDGCPDLDNDGDGLPDTRDGEVDETGFGACRDAAEDFDGFEDGDGCPEEGEGLVALTCEAIEIADSVYFDTGSDVIQSRSYELLGQVATVLNSASYIQLVRVEGHTDDVGGEEMNLDLSQRRAASVMRWLTEDGGVDASRLESEGYGETRPIADNGTRDGRAQNRRVDFVIVSQDSRCEVEVEVNE